MGTATALFARLHRRHSSLMAWPIKDAVRLRNLRRHRLRDALHQRGHDDEKTSLIAFSKYLEETMDLFLWSW